MQEMNNSRSPTAMLTPAMAPPLPAGLEELGVGVDDGGGLHGGGGGCGGGGGKTRPGHGGKLMDMIMQLQSSNNLIITSYYLVHGCTLRAQVLRKLFV